MTIWPLKRDKILKKFKAQTNGMLRKRKFSKYFWKLRTHRRQQLQASKKKQKKNKKESSVFLNDLDGKSDEQDKNNRDNNHSYMDEDCISDTDSISSAEEKDLEILLSGDYNTFFEAYDEIRNFKII